MLQQRSYSTIAKLKPIILFIALIFSISFFYTHADAAIITSFHSSENKESYYTIELKQDKILLEGKTPESVLMFEVYLFTYEGNQGMGTVLTADVINGSYSETYDLPSSNGVPNDGRYQICIQLKDAQGEPYIIVENGVASFYRADSYETDLIGDTFINTMDIDELLASNANTFSLTSSDLSMTSIQIEEIHQLALEVTKGNQNDYDKAKAVYQWVTNNIYYDTASASTTVGNGDNNAYNVYINQYGVCEGYARLVVEMLRSLKIPSVVIGGYAQNAPITKDSGLGHAWTAIYADGRWFYADPTWDSQNKYMNQIFTKGECGFRYFDISLESISITHCITDIEAGINVDDFSVVFFRKHVSIETYVGTDREIILPSKVKSLQITQISGNFITQFNENVKVIIVPEGYEELSGGAFQRYYNLETVVLPDTIQSVEADAFLNSKERVLIYCKDNKAVDDFCIKYGIKLSEKIPSYLNYKSRDFIRNKVNITDVISSKLLKVTYTGKRHEPKPTLTYNGETLILGKDYTLFYINNVTAGKATAMITGIGSYKGEMEITFLILPKKISVHLYKERAKTIQVTWETSLSADGYEVYYSTKKYGTFKKLKDTQLLECTAGKLTSKTTYYFKVRPYVLVDGNKAYGAYSNVASINIK